MAQLEFKVLLVQQDPQDQSALPVHQDRLVVLAPLGSQDLRVLLDQSEGLDRKDLRGLQEQLGQQELLGKLDNLAQ